MSEEDKACFPATRMGDRSVNVPSISRIYVITHILTAEVGDMSKNYHLYPVAAFIQGIELYALLRTKAGQT